jgi:outer membrane protein assembly factor BamB
MRKVILVGIWLCLGLHAIAQKIEVINNDGKFGQNMLTHKEIVGTELKFSDRIKSTYIETESNRMTIQLRGLFMFGQLLKNYGDVILYDLTNKKTIWKKSINYQKYYLEQTGKSIFKTGLEKTYCIDFETGENLWRASHNMAFIDPKLNIGIAYTPYIANRIFYNDINFEGIDLKTGKTIWKQEINHFYGLNDIVQLNDTVAIVVSSGLHSVNLKNGKGWDYDAITGTECFQGTKTEIQSNLIIDSLDIYFASKEEITRLNLNGRIMWSTHLPQDWTSSSNIFLKDSTLYLINTGIARLTYARVKQGLPFLAAYNIKDGRELFLNTVDDKSGKIVESELSEKEIVVLYKDKIAKCSSKNGTLIASKSFDTDKYGELLGFISNTVFNKYDSAYKSLALTDTLNHYVYTTKNKILAINENINVANQYDVDELYKFYLQYNKLRFLTNKLSTIVIDKNNAIVAKIDIAGKAKRIGSKLYFVREKSIVEIDLNEITQVEEKRE